MPNLQCLFCKYVQYFTFRVQLYYLAFCDIEMKMNVLHVIGDLFHIFFQLLFCIEVFFTFSFVLATLISSSKESMVYTKIKLKFTLHQDISRICSHTSCSFNILYSSIYAFQPWIQNMSWTVKKSWKVVRY